MVGTLALGACTEENPFLADDDGDTEAATTSTGGGPTTAGTTMTTASTTDSPTSTTDTTTTAGPTTDAPTTIATSDETEGPTSATDTTVGETGSSSSGVPAVCPETHACVPDLLPVGWAGPVVYGLSDVGAEPNCPEDYPMVQGVAPKTDLMAAPAVCGCECGSASGMSCAIPVLEDHGSAGNCSSPEDTFNLGGGCNDITNQGPQTRWGLDAPGVTGGSCAPQPSTTLPEVSFATSATVCGGAVAGPAGCEEDESCVARPAGEFSDFICIYRAGEHTCPAEGPFEDRLTFHESFDDGRECSTCSCGSPTGSCTGSVALHSSASCDAAGAGTVSTDGCIVGVAGVTVSAARWTQTGITASCTPSVTSPEGEAVPSEAVTFCCFGT